jgi:hypothetical protein
MKVAALMRVHPITRGICEPDSRGDTEIDEERQRNRAADELILGIAIRPRQRAQCEQACAPALDEQLGTDRLALRPDRTQKRARGA